MAQDLINNDLHVNGALSCKTFTAPNSSITNAAVQAAAAIASTKLQHRDFDTTELFGPTTTVTALTKWLKTIKGVNGTVLSFSAAIAVVATDPSRTITVDLQKSTAGGAFATICSATIGFTNGSSVRTQVSASFSSTVLVAGDILQVVVTVAGGVGVQAQGLTVALATDQDAV